MGMKIRCYFSNSGFDFFAISTESVSTPSCYNICVFQTIIISQAIDNINISTIAQMNANKYQKIPRPPSKGITQLVRILLTDYVDYLPLSLA